MLIPSLESGGVLISRAVASQVPSALRGLTSVFGMGTGGALLLSSPESVSAAFCFACMLLLLAARSLRAGFRLAPSKPHSGKLTCKVAAVFLLLEYRFRSLSLMLIASDQAVDLLVSASSRIAPLSPPTYLLIVSQGSSYLRTGIFFLRWASRLDAFSVYPLRISLPSCAVGTTTVAPGMRPLRSSRTRSSSSHDSFAHDG